MVPLVMFDSLIFLVADRATSECTNSATNQCTCRFVVAFVTNRNSQRGAREAAENNATAAILSILRVGFGTDEGGN